MEFQEGLMRLMIQEPAEKQWQSRRSKKKTPEKKDTAVTRSRKWRIFQRSPSSTTTPTPPSEFLCPISGSLMAEPVIVSSGHTFERACAEACRALGFAPAMADSSAADFSSVIPNLALKSAIAAWCGTSSAGAPAPPAPAAAEKLVREFAAASRGQLQTQSLTSGEEKTNSNNDGNVEPIATELARRRRGSGYCSSSSSAETASPKPSPSLRDSSSSSSEVEIGNPSFLFEEEEILAKMKSQSMSEVEEGLAALRRITRTREDARAHLCSYRLLSALRSLIPSRHAGVRANAAAAVVNLSLEDSNKSKIVRSGIVPALVGVLRAGPGEAQEHAAAAVFSLALDNDSKTAVGVLGALPPLVGLLQRPGSERARRDAALALYHLSLVQTNRAKLVKLGAVPALLGMVRAGHMPGRVVPVLANLGACPEGRAALMDAGAVECMAGVLAGGPGSAREGAVAVLFALSHGGLRFKALAREAGVAEALRGVEETGSERARRQARAVAEALKGRPRGDEEDDVNWEELLESGFGSGSRSRFSSGASSRAVG